MSNADQRKDMKANQQRIAKEKKFLKAMTDLTLKHGIKVGGCGCCGSPYLTHVDKAELNEQFRYTCSDGGDDVYWCKDE